MTREELIEVIVTEVVSASQGPDFGTGISGQEYAFQNMVGRITRKQTKKKLGFKNPGMHESMAELQRVGSKTMKKVTKSYKRNVVRPIRSTHRAVKYKEKAHKVALSGRWGRSAEMKNRADKVISGHKPALVGAAVGAMAGVAFPTPGGVEAGAVIGSKGGQMMRKLARARA